MIQLPLIFDPIWIRRWVMIRGLIVIREESKSIKSNWIADQNE